MGTAFVVRREGLAALVDRAECVAIARLTHAAGCVEMPLAATICSTLRRSRVAIVRAQAWWTTGTSSRGTTNKVRRIPSMRTTVRSM